MKKLKLALQLYSVRDDIEKDFYSTLVKIKNMGYDGVEFAGLFGYKPEEIKNMCEEIGVNPISAHVPFVEMIENPERIMQTYSTIGCEYIAIPYLLPEYRPGSAKFDEIIAGAKVLGKTAREYGMQLLYHNHDFEFTKLNGEYALDVLYHDVSSDCLQTEIDTCWVNVSNVNPSLYILKYSDRAPVVHLKDYFGEKSENMYKLIGIKDENKRDTNTFEFRPVGYGVQDFISILFAAEKAGTEWVIVEQDEPSMGKSALECAAMSSSYLMSIM